MMSLGKSIVFLLIAILGTHVFALVFNWYWELPTLDVILHFAGGAWIALMFVWAILRWPEYASFSAQAWLLVFIGLSVVSFTGVLWEFFEFCFDIFIGGSLGAAPAQLGLRDTLSDLVFDLLGGAFILLWYVKKKYYAIRM